jgi:excisionase family DNA binding protein
VRAAVEVCSVVPPDVVLGRELLVELRRLRSFSQGAFSVAAAAGYLDVSGSTVRQWLREGKLSPVPHTGRRVLIARVECDRFAAGTPRP